VSNRRGQTRSKKSKGALAMTKVKADNMHELHIYVHVQMGNGLEIAT
jgi:hypothetical protein